MQVLGWGLTFLGWLFKDVVEEISSVFAEPNPSIDHLRSVSIVLYSCFDQLSGTQIVHQTQQSVVSECNGNSAELEVAEKVADPGVSASMIKTLERFTEG